MPRKQVRHFLFKPLGLSYLKNKWCKPVCTRPISRLADMTLAGNLNGGGPWSLSEILCPTSPSLPLLLGGRRLPSSQSELSWLRTGGRTPLVLQVVKILGPGSPYFWKLYSRNSLILRVALSVEKNYLTLVSRELTRWFKSPWPGAVSLGSNLALPLTSCVTLDKLLKLCALVSSSVTGINKNTC